ncbi:Sodium:dicarboxylate symporter [Pterulicium gracile]|uniref:Amino acid transporter n=1 Tax=Pterulicium gracile TaxID=1884261 RepID=A0A5C3Q2I8_9AGAR|nr:Sodium:dicarboxylate symporter [Pterula gracilis]
MSHDTTIQKEKAVSRPNSVTDNLEYNQEYNATPLVQEKKPWWHSVKVWGSATQIVIAAILGLALGLIVSTQVEVVPPAATEILNIPGDLWLRALKAVVMPLIICAMIMAVQRLREMGQGSGRRLAIYTVTWYVVTTLFSIGMSCVMTALVWKPLFKVAAADSRSATGASNPPHMVVKQMFQSFVADNIVNALATNSLLAVLIMACVVGYLIRDRNSMILKLVVEVEQMIMIVIAALIAMAPFGVFFLVLSSLLKLDIADIGENLGLLIAGTLGTMGIHVFIILPGLFFIITRQNPYSFWIKISPAWVTAWGSASSAATLPVTLRVCEERGIPKTVYKFTAPLGCLINMDGTAIYFPMAVVFLAATQGHELLATDYVIICLLATLASIGVSPIPSASLVLIVMICNSIGVEVTGMFAVIVAIDWLLDRFRTAVNVSGDLFAGVILTKLTGLRDDPDMREDEMVHAQKTHHVDDTVQRV